jgi:hypothetical protein
MSRDGASPNARRRKLLNNPSSSSVPLLVATNHLTALQSALYFLQQKRFLQVCSKARRDRCVQEKRRRKVVL